MAYQLSGPPTDLEPLKEVLGEGGSLNFETQTNILTCHYAEQHISAAELNRRIVPLLLSQCGLLTISQGSSLEEEYLKQTVGALQPRAQ
jgi:hypothetical protein